ncbi:hypothetical protein ABW20_dc0104915 [Dactylellina cionopaga]|nr:hypothetical protein ABW20_dc0104915 [Dactylellina cionopaga]
MSVSEHSHQQCSADTSSGVDGSGPHAFGLSDLGTAVCAADPDSKHSSMSHPSLPEAPDTDSMDEAELDLLPSLPSLKTDCESLTSHVDASSPSAFGALDLSSPNTRTPTSPTSSIASLSHDAHSEGGVSLHKTDPADSSWLHSTDQDASLPSGGVSLHHALAPHGLSTLQPSDGGSSNSHGDTSFPDPTDTTAQNSQGSPPSPSVTATTASENTEWLPAVYDLSSSQDSGVHSPSVSSDVGGSQASSLQPATDAQDIFMDSVYDDTDFSSDEDLTHDGDDVDADHEQYLGGITSAQFTDVAESESPEPSSAEINTGVDDPFQAPNTATETSPAEFSFELFGEGTDVLAEFDFDTFLSQPDPMDLDNPTFNPTASPQNIPTINTAPQIFFPPHIQPIPQQWLTNHPNLPFGIFQGNGNGFFAFTATVDDDSPEWPGPQFHGEYERNLSFADFCNMLSARYRQDPLANHECKINPDFIEILNFHMPLELNRKEVDEYNPDYQGIPWRELEMERPAFRLLRNRKYSNYANMKPYPEPQRNTRFLPIRENYFRFRKTCNSVDVRYSHFQLRNVVSSVSKNDVFYTGDSTVVRIDPHSSERHTVMNLRKPCSGDPIKITTLASDFGVIIAGGFYGEYAMKSLDSPFSTRPVEGLVTTDSNGITNHVHFFQSRSTSTPRAVFSSNDEKLRVLDCYLNKMVSEYKLPWAINCSDTSPDGRLRVIVGDAKEVVIQSADNGETIHRLPGHLDYGFACAWSDDGHTIATGNQDMMVRVYDARNFKKEVAVLDADMAGARSLRFTPVGSGPRVLAFAEPADMVSIVDAVTWESRQRIDFFGEVAGISFSPDGRELYIANSDKMVGGLMQFDRWKSGHPGYPDEDPDRDDSDSDVGLSRRRMRLRDVNMDYLGII